MLSSSSSTSTTTTMSLHLFTGPFVAYPTEYFFSSFFNHPITFSRFFSVSSLPSPIRVDISIIYISFDERRETETETETGTHTHQKLVEWMCVCVCARQNNTDREKTTRVELYLPISNSTAHIKSAQSSIVARCK